MKIAKRVATVLRIIGWVMVALAVGVTIYALATSGGPMGRYQRVAEQVRRFAERDRPGGIRPSVL